MPGKWYEEFVEELREYAREGRFDYRVEEGEGPDGISAVEVYFESFLVPGTSVRVRIKPFYWRTQYIYYHAAYTLYEGSESFKGGTPLFTRPRNLKIMLVHAVSLWKHERWYDWYISSFERPFDPPRSAALNVFLTVSLMTFLSELAASRDLGPKVAEFLASFLPRPARTLEVLEGRALAGALRSVLAEFWELMRAGRYYYGQLADAIALAAHAHGLIEAGEVVDASRRLLSIFEQTLRLLEMLSDAGVVERLYEELAQIVGLVLEEATKHDRAQVYDRIIKIIKDAVRPTLTLLSELATPLNLPSRILGRAGDSITGIIYAGRTSTGAPVYLVVVRGSMIVATTKPKNLEITRLALAGFCCDRLLLVPKHEKSVVLGVVRGKEWTLRLILESYSTAAKKAGKKGVVEIGA